MSRTIYQEYSYLRTLRITLIAERPNPGPVTLAARLPAIFAGHRAHRLRHIEDTANELVASVAGVESKRTKLLLHLVRNDLRSCFGNDPSLRFGVSQIFCHSLLSPFHNLRGDLTIASEIIMKETILITANGTTKGTVVPNGLCPL